MKLTKSNLEKLLTSLGLQDVQLVENDAEADEFNEESVISQFLNTKEPIYKQKFESEILPEKLKEVAGQFGGKLKTSVRKISGNQIKSSELDGKSDEEVLQIFAEFLQKDKDASTDSLRNQIKELSVSHNEELEKIKNDYEGKLSGKEKEFDNFQIESFLSDLVGKMPLLGSDPKVKVNVLKSAIETNYTPVWNREKRDLELREKDNPERIAQLDQNTLLKPSVYAENLFKDLGMVKQDMSNERAADYIQKGNGEPSKSDLTANQNLPFQNFEQHFANAE